MPLNYTRNNDGPQPTDATGAVPPEGEGAKGAPAQPNNPLHGVKLADIVAALVDHYGWEELGRRITINCFISDPSIKSSLKFLRKTPWAREKVEQLYIRMPKR